MVAVTRILLADKNPLFRIGICTALSNEEDIEIVGEATNASEVQLLCKQVTPHLLLLDLDLLETLEELAFLHESCAGVKILVLAASDDIDLRSVIAFGVTGCILKTESPATLASAIYTTSQGDTWFSQVLLNKIVRDRVDNGQVNNLNLTDREQQLLKLINQGWDNNQIATDLCLGKQTVRNYVTRLYAKLGVGSRVEAIIWAREHGKNFIF
jgi:DNA-binding NarL/FixJ family response regulator